jgi:hypothetical protein
MTDVDPPIETNGERADRERRELAAVVEAKYGRMPPSPIRQRGETDEMFLARLKEWRNGPRLPLPAEQPSQPAEVEP